ncbi:MAG: GNAT family N-acetyltransferase [Methanomicrobia archaeon]|nr:GNAT family N-acetyltransferase [Methanomicrobia archaeon]
MLQIREYQPKDREKVKRLVLELNKYYPSIEGWIDREIQRIENNESKCLVVELDNEIGGVAISAMTKFPKKNDIVKLKTFYLSEDFREYGMGPYLLERVIDEWVKDKAKKIYVTFAEEEVDELKSFFDKYGFLFDGISPLVYRDIVSEYIMSKVLIYNKITEEKFVDFICDYLLRLRGYRIKQRDGADVIVERVNGLKSQINTFVRILTEPDPPKELIEEIETKRKEHGCSNSLLVSYYPVDIETGKLDVIDGYDIENFFYPLRMRRKKYAGIIAPVKPVYANQLLYDGTQALLSPHKKSLRRDKVFYKYPSAYREVRRGSTFVFYVSDPVKAIIGEGKIERVVIDTPENLYNEYEQKGVLSLKEVKTYADTNNKVLAFVIGKVTRCHKKIPIDVIRSEIKPGFDPQGSCFISQKELDTIRKLGVMNHER